MYIQDICDVKSQEGEIGIEVEVEGIDLPDHIVGWKREHDGSLRGESCEYVLKKPCTRDRLPLYVGRVYEAYEEAGSSIHSSHRQSVHIHINVQDLTVSQIFGMIVTFLIFEEILVDYCGDGRTGNLFCLRSCDAEFMVSQLEHAASKGDVSSLFTDSLRYSALNTASLYKFGSLEFRSMRGGTDKETLTTWIEMLLSIKDFAIKKGNPMGVMSDYLEMGMDDFIKEVFGDNGNIIADYEGYHKAITKSARNVKMLSFTGDWDTFSKGDRPIIEEVEEEEDTGYEMEEAELEEEEEDTESESSRRDRLETSAQFRFDTTYSVRSASIDPAVAPPTSERVLSREELADQALERTERIRRLVRNMHIDDETVGDRVTGARPPSGW